MDKIVTFSMNGVTLYPSIMNDMSMEAIKSAIMKREIVWEKCGNSIQEKKWLMQNLYNLCHPQVQDYIKILCIA